jgi:hypothetical protein
MSAIEIIEEIKKLPDEEQRKIAAYLHEIERKNATNPGQEVSPEFKRAADQIFTTNAELFGKLAK